MCFENNEEQILKKELEIENEVLMQNIKQFQDKIQEQEKEIQKIEVEKKILKDDNINIRKSYDMLQDEYNKIIYSRSYRITRKIVNLLKGR